MAAKKTAKLVYNWNEEDAPENITVEVTLRIVGHKDYIPSFLQYLPDHGEGYDVRVLEVTAEEM